MDKKAKRIIGIASAIVIIVIALIAVIALRPSGNDDFNENNEDTTPPSPPPTNESEKQPDLAVYYFYISPDEPFQNTYFYGSLEIINNGDAPSGEYDVHMNITDIDRGLTYPIGTFSQSPLDAGQSYRVWTSHDLLVNDPGNFQFNIEIKPIDFTDADTTNNRYHWPFMALPLK